VYLSFGNGVTATNKNDNDNIQSTGLFLLQVAALASTTQSRHGPPADTYRHATPPHTY